MQYEFTSPLWLYPGDAGWHFISVPLKESGEIKALFAGQTRGFGSLRVRVTIGDVSWTTSIFPDSKTKCYMLPVKAEVRKKVGIKPGDKVPVILEVLT